MAKKQFDARATFDLPADLLERVDLECGVYKTRSDILREAVLEYLDRKDRERKDTDAEVYR